MELGGFERELKLMSMRVLFFLWKASYIVNFLTLKCLFFFYLFLPCPALSIPHKVGTNIVSYA